MGVKSTFDIERETALEIISRKLEECSNEQLADMLECFDESTYRNYSVYDKFPENHDSQSRTITSLFDFEL